MPFGFGKDTKEQNINYVDSEVSKTLENNIRYFTSDQDWQEGYSLAAPDQKTLTQSTKAWAESYFNKKDETEARKGFNTVVRAILKENVFNQDHYAGRNLSEEDFNAKIKPLYAAHSIEMNESLRNEKASKLSPAKFLREAYDDILGVALDLMEIQKKEAASRSSSGQESPGASRKRSGSSDDTPATPAVSESVQAAIAFGNIADDLARVTNQFKETLSNDALKKVGRASNAVAEKISPKIGRQRSETNFSTPEGFGGMPDSPPEGTPGAGKGGSKERT
jgi:hypothetical protein